MMSPTASSLLIAAFWAVVYFAVAWRRSDKGVSGAVDAGKFAAVVFVVAFMVARGCAALPRYSSDEETPRECEALPGKFGC